MSRTPTTPPSNRKVQWLGEKLAFAAPQTLSSGSKIPELRARAANTVGIANEKIRAAHLTLRQCGLSPTKDTSPLRATTSSTATRVISAARASLRSTPTTTTGNPSTTRMRNSLLLSQLQAPVRPK
jgi:hypothetical protein